MARMTSVTVMIPSSFLSTTGTRRAPSAAITAATCSMLASAVTVGVSSMSSASSVLVGLFDQRLAGDQSAELFAVVGLFDDRNRRELALLEVLQHVGAGARNLDGYDLRAGRHGVCDVHVAIHRPHVQSPNRSTFFRRPQKSKISDGGSRDLRSLVIPKDVVFSDDSHESSALVNVRFPRRSTRRLREPSSKRWSTRAKRVGLGRACSPGGERPVARFARDRVLRLCRPHPNCSALRFTTR